MPTLFRFLKGKAKQYPGLVAIIDNIGWLFFDKFLRLGIGLFVGAWVARYLGPEKYGMINYAQAFVSLLTTISVLGLPSIVIRNLVKNPSNYTTILGSALTLRLVGGLSAWLIAIFAINILRSGDDVVTIIVAIFGAALAINSVEVFKYWFESRVLSKYIVWSTGVVFLVIAVFKILLIVEKASLMDFVWVYFLSSCLTGLGFLWLFESRTRSLLSLKVKWKEMKNLLRDSWPLILSGLAATVYMRIDKLFVGEFLDDKAVGVYSAAAQISDILNFVPAAICISVFPAIVRAKEKNEMLYKNRLRILFSLLFISSLFVALPMTFLSGSIISLIFGDQYVEAGAVLAVHIWASVFVFLGMGSSRWYIAENMQKLLFYRSLAGALINVVLNIILIPEFKIMGAAWSLVLSQVFVGVISNSLSRRTFPLFILQIRAVFFIDVLLWVFKYKESWKK